MRSSVWFLLAALVVTPKLHADEPQAPAPESEKPGAPEATPPAGLELDALSPPEGPSDAGSPFVVRVLLKGCSEFTKEEVERVLTAELAVESPHSEGVHEPTWVVVECEANKVVVEVHDPVSRKIVQRRFDFISPKTQARGRLVAVAAAELILASWAELAVLPPLRVEPEGQAPNAQQRGLARKRVKAEAAGAAKPRPTLLLGTDPAVAREGRGPSGERIIYDDYVWERLPGRFQKRLVVLGSLRAFPGTSGALVGGGLRFGSDSLPLHGWAVDTLFETGKVGSVQVQNFTLGGMLYLARDVKPGIILRAGAGLRAGLEIALDETRDEQVTSPIFWGWPLLALSGSARFGKLVIELATEGSYATLPSVRGSADTSRGIWLCAQLGIGYSLQP